MTPRTYHAICLNTRRRGPRSRAFRLAALLAALAPGWHAMAQQYTNMPRLTAEEDRLNIGVFRAGLKKRGLQEILDLHLADFPPGDKIDALLLSREVKLAEYADRSRARDYRMRVLAESNDMLRTLIKEHPDDKRCVDWQFALARSLLYEQAEPLITKILYRGWTEADRAALRPQTNLAVETSDALLEHLKAEYARIDAMTIPEFERLETTGYIDRLDELMPKAKYVRLWALYYDSLAYRADDPERATRLNQVLAGLEDMKQLIATPHDESHVQIQAMTLLGMTFSRLNQHRQAREALQRALAIGQRLSDPDEAKRVAWAVQLAHLEFIRNERGDERFEKALTAAQRFADGLPAGDDGFGMRLVIALEQREIHRAWAKLALRRSDQTLADEHERLAWQTLVHLTREYPTRRGEIYGAVNERIDPNTPREKLDPFEQCAQLAELLTDDTRSDEALRAAIRLGDQYFKSASAASAALAGDLLFQLAAAEYRLGDVKDAARRFLRLSRDYQGSPSAQRAATLAVQLAATLETEGKDASANTDQLYGDALAHLLDAYPQSDDAGYWRFFYAQHLDRAGRFQEAAKQYAQVVETHEHYAESLFLEIRALSRAVETELAAGTLTGVEARRSVDTLMEKYRAFVTKAGVGLPKLPNEAARHERRDLLVRAKVTVGETLVLPGVDRHAAALDLLADFETGVSNHRDLAARVWRVRLTAYQALGRLDEAARAIPAYLAADPTDAGPTMQALFTSVAQDVRRAAFDDMDDAMKQKAQLVLLLAQHIHDWAMSPESHVSEAQRLAVKAQLAEAYLWAGQYEAARDAFAALRSDGGGAQNQRIVFGYAESLFRLGRFDEALDEFNRLATGLAATDSVRWKALLRDLQCRSALEEDPTGIIKVIEQQKFLYPDLGGPELSGQFERLLRDNQRRRDQQ